MTTTISPELLTADQLEQYAKLIYSKAGIRISAQKTTMLSNRLRRRLKALELPGFDEYLSLLRRLPERDPEWEAFLQVVSTHETYLFRDEMQWDWFTNDFLGEVVKQVRKGERDKTLRVWSAACSTGDEAYTIASCIADTVREHARWRINIVGTDIGFQAVEEARKAEFGARSMKRVPEKMKSRFFEGPSERTTWKAKPPLTDWTEFHQHNLLKPFAAEPFDIVFLKNVLIYFDADAKRRALKHIENNLKPGGLLVTAAADGVGPHLQQCSKQSVWLFQKQ